MTTQFGCFNSGNAVVHAGRRAHVVAIPFDSAKREMNIPFNQVPILYDDMENGYTIVQMSKVRNIC
jgi:hypothetical protein